MCSLIFYSKIVKDFLIENILQLFDLLFYSKYEKIFLKNNA